MSVTIRGIDFQANDDNDMGLEFVNLSHRYGFQCPNWPYFKDVQIDRQHYMAKSGVLSQTITTTMHVTTHIDAPAPRGPGHAVHRRGAAAALLRLRAGGERAQEEVGSRSRATT